MDAVNDVVKSEAGKVEENDTFMDMMKLDGQDVAEKGEKMGCKGSSTFEIFVLVLHTSKGKG